MSAAFIRAPTRESKPLAASRLADGELQHLGVVLAYLLENKEARFIRPLDFTYWRDRLESINRVYALVPTQRVRLAALRRQLIAMKAE